ncbi:MAG: CBS domain-containing protein [candidate division Zixibacteria bacterium]|nr:CBS domain-containing protein [candidate division Zixibacteria bacterium]NIX59967.1 CBS domain-containing protein [candidate division Zixibacteria bacterium]
MSQSVHVSQVMMPGFKKIDGVTRVSEALKLMKENKLNAILIEPRDDADVFGILTLKDIARKVIAQRRKLYETHVYEIMSKPVLSLPANMPVPYAARLLTNFNVSYAMVIESDQVVGLVSLNGIVNNWDLE